MSITTRPVGHKDTITMLEQGLPQVTLLRGPASVGKWSIAEYLADYFQIGPSDLQKVEHLTTLEASRIREFLSRRATGPQRLIISRLDDASESALQTLLKVLEEPPVDTHFILTATGGTLNTVESRAEIFQLGLLTPTEIAQLYRQRDSLLPSTAKELAALAEGSGILVNREEAELRAGTVTNFLRAVTDANEDLLNRALRGWDRQTHQLLHTWVTEALTGSWQFFSPASVPKLTNASEIRTLLSTLRRSGRPAFVARQAVEPLLAHRRNSY